MKVTLYILKEELNEPIFEAFKILRIKMEQQIIELSKDIIEDKIVLDINTWKVIFIIMFGNFLKIHKRENRKVSNICRNIYVQCING